MITEALILKLEDENHLFSWNTILHLKRYHLLSYSFVQECEKSICNGLKPFEITLQKIRLDLALISKFSHVLCNQFGVKQNFIFIN